MIGRFLYDGKMSSHYGIYISGSGTYNAPERDIEAVSIPGKNGDLIIDNQRYKNISVAYPAFIRQKFKASAQAARIWLAANYEYKRLEDSYHPEYFRLARFSGPLDFDMRFLNKSGECTITFDCKPQRFLKEGEMSITAEGAIRLYNPTGQKALPRFRVYGSGAGTLAVGNTIMELTEIDGYVDIDCDTQNAYKGNENCNNRVSNAFPVLESGQTGISFSGGIERIEIIPRWWTI